MNGMILAIAGLVFGLVFGLLLAWGYISLFIAMIGVAVMLVGSFFPTMFRAVFITAILGFLLAWIVSGGLSLL